MAAPQPSTPTPAPSPYAPPPSMPTPQLPRASKAFRTSDDFFDFFDNIVCQPTTVGSMSTTYEERRTRLFQDIDTDLRDRNTCWFGKPIPANITEALERKRYQRMDDFNLIYRTEILPRIEELLKNSKADLEIPQIQYNDRGLGVFDFGRASLGLRAIYKYYSLKKKDFVDGFDCEFVEGVKYKLKEDGSDVVIVPKILTEDKELVHEIYIKVFEGENIFDLLKKYKLRIGGTDSISSSIKKVYQYKEKKIKPRNAVKIFVQIGYNCNIVADDNCEGVPFEQAKWNGYAAIGIAEILTAMGYQVSIIGVYGMYIYGGINVGGGTLQAGRVFYSIVLKKFQETLDTPSLLYFLSDSSFFRIRIFDVIVKSCSFRGDYVDSGLNRTCGLGELENFVYTEYAPKDKIYTSSGILNPTSPLLYYCIGSAYSIEDLRNLILQIGLDVVEKNKLARRTLGIT